MDQGFSVEAQESGDFGQRLRMLAARRGLQLILLALAVAATYLHTLGVPFYLDDYSSLLQNPAVRDYGSALDFAPGRQVGYLSFAFNYSLHGYALAGYHAFNILIHLAASIAVYLLASAILRSRHVAPYRGDEARLWLPLLAALLFALHPLQTQAVTYITQRLASLAALFYLLSLAAYLQGRLSEVPGRRLLCFGLAGAAAVLAFFTKQNTVTLPLAVLLLEICLLRPPRRHVAALLGLGVAGTLAVALFFQFGLGMDFVEVLAANTQETDTLTRGQYFTLQMQVLWDYLLKFFLPFGLHLDYDLPIPQSFWTLQTLAFSLGHLALLGGAVALIRRSPVIAFGILFYYCAHLVESSVIPIRDYGFEHRTYLPNVGLCLAAAWAVLVILPRRLPREAVAGLAVAVVAVLGVLTWLRNDVWRDPVAFFQHEIEVNPVNLRAHSMLGESLLRLGRPAEALRAYQNAEPLVDVAQDRSNNTVAAYYSNFLLALDQTGNRAAALELYDALNIEAMTAEHRSRFLMLRGVVLGNLGRLPEAEEAFTRAAELNAGNLEAKTNLAKLMMLTGRPERARELYEDVYARDSTNAEAAAGLENFQGAR